MKSRDKFIHIKPADNFLKLDINELIEYKDLFVAFAERDIKVRYKQTIFGIAWAVIQPLLSMIIFSIFFGNLAKIPSGVLPYPLFVLSGLVFWSFFTNSITHASDSMIANESIIKKVYFPKIILPISSIIVSSIDFSINLAILIIYALLNKFVPSTYSLLIFPLCFITTCITALGIGLFLSSFNVKYRDVRYILPFFIQILMFLTPVIYPLSIVAPNNRLIMALNPMTSVIELVRAVIAGGKTIEPSLIIVSFLSSVTCLLIGFWYFKRTEQFISDIA